MIVVDLVPRSDMEAERLNRALQVADRVEANVRVGTIDNDVVGERVVVVDILVDQLEVGVALCVVENDPELLTLRDRVLESDALRVSLKVSEYVGVRLTDELLDEDSDRDIVQE